MKRGRDGSSICSDSPGTSRHLRLGLRVTTWVLLLVAVALSGVEGGELQVLGAAASSGAFGLRVDVGPACTEADVVIPPGTFQGESPIACDTLTANDVDVIAPGATFRAGQEVALGNAFSVGTGADFIVDVDSSVTDPWAFVEDDRPTAATGYDASFEVRLDSLILADGDELDHLNGYSADGKIQFRAALRRNVALGENRLALFAREDGDALVELPTDFLIPSGYQAIRLSWTAGSGTGQFLASVGDAPMSGLTGLSNTGSRIDYVRWGAVAGAVSTTTGYIDQDEFLACPFGDGFESGDLCAWSGSCPVPSPDPSTSVQILTARQAADGPVDIAIDDVLVTYTKGTIGNDLAGFFVQAEQQGPALFVGVDPAILTPAPTAGDVVSLRITEMDTSFTLRQATQLADWSVEGTGGRTECVLQDVSLASDLVTDLDLYETELVSLEGTITDLFEFEGLGFESAPVETAAIVGSELLKFRVPSMMRDALDLAGGCTFDLAGTPLWRIDSEAHSAAWVAEDFAALTCPAPVVVSAAATVDAISVTVNFSRQIDAASVLGDGSQFTFDEGLTASAAVVSGRAVTVTTSTQTPDTLYTVTVASTVLDTLGSGVSGDANTAMFVAYAKVGIQEVYYDAVGVDSEGNVFTEIFGPPGKSLDSWTLEGVNGSTGSSYNAFALNGAVIPDDGLLVIATSAATGEVLAARDFVSDAVDWQNGPDAVRLLDSTGVIVDALQYGDAGVNNAGEGTPAPDVTEGNSLSRAASSTDTDDNATDFTVGEPSPGVH